MTDLPAAAAATLAHLSARRQAHIDLIRKRQPNENGILEPAPLSGSDTTVAFPGLLVATELQFTIDVEPVGRFTAGDITLTVQSSVDEGDSWDTLVSFDEITNPTGEDDQPVGRVRVTKQADPGWGDWIRVSWSSGDGSWLVSVRCDIVSTFGPASLGGPFLKGLADPTADAGVAAAIGTLYRKTDNGTVWSKTDTGDTDWQLLAFD